MAWRISSTSSLLWLPSSPRLPCALLPRIPSMLRVLLTMTESATKPKSQAPLRVVKVTPISAAYKSTTNSDSDNKKASDTTAQEKIPIEEMVNKGLDLAETGIGLGVNIVARLGSIFKDQVFDKINSSEMLNAAMSNTSDSQPEAEQPYYPEESQAPTSDQTATTDQSSYLFNRLPIFPGGHVSLSFSINNDSLSSKKEIKLKLEPFVGEAHQQSIDTGAFSVSPPETVIAPADFEKFVITGNIPKDAPEDTYYGWVIVSEQQTYQIPVVLMVSKAHDISTEQMTTQATEQQPESLTEPLTEPETPQVLEE